MDITAPKGQPGSFLDVKRDYASFVSFLVPAAQLDPMAVREPQETMLFLSHSGLCSFLTETSLDLPIKICRIIICKIHLSTQLPSSPFPALFLLKHLSPSPCCMHLTYHPPPALAGTPPGRHFLPVFCAVCTAAPAHSRGSMRVFCINRALFTREEVRCRDT